MSQATWNFLQPGDVIDVIAPSSPPSDPAKTIGAINAFFDTIDLKVNIPEGLIAPTHPLEEANTIERRVADIKAAILNPESKAIWAIMGGGWGTELMEPLRLSLSETPSIVKPILGYSDVTAMHIFANHNLQWPSIHCVELGVNADISPGWNKDSLKETLDMLTGVTTETNYTMKLLNPDTMGDGDTIKTSIVGGNSILVNVLAGTDDFTLDTKGKTLMIESVARSPGEQSRVLEKILFSKLGKEANAILLANFVQKGGHPNEPLVQEQFDYLRQRFADNLSIPVLSTDIFGHGPVNRPLPFLTEASIQRDGDNAILTVSSN